MKRIFILLFSLVALSGYSQTITSITRDIVNASDELNIRDSTIMEVISANSEDSTEVDTAIKTQIAEYAAGDTLTADTVSFAYVAGTSQDSIFGGITVTGTSNLGGVLFTGSTHTAGAFYTGSTTPTANSRLNFGGNIVPFNLLATAESTTLGNGVVQGTYTGSGNTYSGVRGVANNGGVGVIAVGITTGTALFANQTGTPIGHVSDNLFNITRDFNANYNYTGNLINIVDNPTTSSTISGKVLTATIGATERISLNPRQTSGASNTSYFLDTHNDMILGSLFEVRNQGAFKFKVKKDSVVVKGVLKIGSGSNIIETTTDGDFKYQLSHGTMYIDAATYTPNVTQNAAFKITPGLTVQDADYLTMQGDSVTFTRAGDYQVNAAITINGSVATDWRFSCFKNGVAQTSMPVITTTGAGNYVNVSWFWYIQAAVNDDVSFRLTNLSNNNDPTLRNMVVYVVKQAEDN